MTSHASTNVQMRAVKPSLGDPPKAGLRRWTLLVAAEIFVLMATAAPSQPPPSPESNAAKPTLPPRALVRIGTDAMRTTDFIRVVAFSPDGRLIAAADSNAPSPQVAIFDVRTGRRVKQLVAPGKKGGWVEAVAFSPDGTKLLWGENGGEVALWELAGDRLLFREKLHEGTVSAVEVSPDGGLIASARAAMPSASGRSQSPPKPCANSSPTRPSFDAREASDAWRSHPTGRGSWQEPPAMPHSSSGGSRMASSFE